MKSKIIIGIGIVVVICIGAFFIVRYQRRMPAVVRAVDRTGLSDQINKSDTPEEKKVYAQTEVFQKMKDDYGITEDQIMNTAIVSHEWADACLGLPHPDEVCAQVLTSGYMITFTTNSSSQYTYHANSDATTIRLEEEK